MASAAAAPPPAAPPPAKPIDLSDKLEKSECYARNEDTRFPWANLLMGDTRLGCKSDADEQLILHFEFSEFVKVHSIKLTEFNNGTDPEENPTREYSILLYCIHEHKQHCRKMMMIIS